jgi:hypothetical protein
VHHDVGTKVADQPVDDAPVDNAVLDQLQPRLRFQIIAPAGREIINREDFVAAGEQQVDDGRADETRPAGYKYFHIGLILFTALLRSSGSRQGVKRCSFRQHAPVMSGAIMKDLVP